ncbi:MAG TPA: hypothetical protein VF406_03490 [Thermodesulfobacteriota bacterium]
MSLLYVYGFVPAGTLSPEETERVGVALMRLEELNLDLGRLR